MAKILRMPKLVTGPYNWGQSAWYYSSDTAMTHGGKNAVYRYARKGTGEWAIRRAANWFYWYQREGVVNGTVLWVLRGATLWLPKCVERVL